MEEKAKIKSPEEFYKIIKKYFNSERKFIFILTFILAVITNFLLLSNLILSQDGLLNSIHYTAGDYETSLGRWGINFFDSLRYNIAFPFITTIISIIIMCFINILIIEIFEIKSKIFKIITILSVVASPSICMTLLYSYTADAYIYAMFFSVLSAYSLYKIKNRKLGITLTIISFIIMLGVYQSYMGITIGIIVMISIKKLLLQENTSLKILKELFINAIILICAMILYFIITLLFQKIGNINMSTYGGANQIGFIEIITSLKTSIKTAYLGFIKYFFADGIILNRIWKREILYMIFFTVLFITLIILFLKLLKNKNRENIIKVIFISALIILLPIALNLVIIIAPGNEIYYLTATQMILIFPFAFTLFEAMGIENSVVNLLNWSLSLVSLIIMSTYMLSIIVTYETLDISYNQAKAVSNRIITRMEECPGYRTNMNKLFAGVIDDVNFPKTLDIYNFSITNGLRSSILHGTYWGQEATWKNFINLFCGTSLNFCSDDEYNTIINTDEFKEMDIFPGENSVKIINDVMVVKFCDNPAVAPVSEK